MKEPLLQDNVTSFDHGIAVPSEHEGLEHQADGVCYLGLVPAHAAAGRCGLRIPSCGGQCSPWKPHSKVSAMTRLNGEPVVILAQERFELLYGDTSLELEPGKVSTQPRVGMTGAKR